ncbi:hypothetical protein K2X85_02520 [bacterium]|jgi:hypothetical protein|nr:hypothetical protein [bacterium]
MNDLRVDWLGQATQRLIDIRQSAAGWPYRQGGVPAAEPTAWCSLAMLALDPESKTSLDLSMASAMWLASIQRADGAVGISATQRTPEWPTPYALLLWTSLGRNTGACTQATNWLLSHQGIVFEKPPGSPLGHDTTIAGWSWVEQTHSWLEPTAMAVLALRRAGLADHPRVREGISLIVDRAIPDGGWNFGNSIAFGRALRPKPAPTGMALLALAGVVEKSDTIGRALDYLESELPTVRSGLSLGFGLLGLMAWGRRPAGSAIWLKEAWPAVAIRADGALPLATMMMATTLRTLSLLGLPMVSGGEHG